MNTDEVMSPPQTEAEPSSSSPPAPKNPPWLVDVDVYLQPEGIEPRFYLETYLPKDSEDRIKFKNHDRPGYTIKFNLHDPHGTGYCFPPNSKRDEAVWSQFGNACPTSERADVFQVQRVVEPDRTTVVVYNENPEPEQGEFGYTLRVTKDDGLNYLALDPGGINQNGGSK
jgi:hypothetical protein